MHKIFSLLALLCCTFMSKAQWLNTANQFTDDTHMPVSIATNDQTNPISIVSYPDSGVIVAWIDWRNGNRDIYAQKFDKNGNSLWAADGIAVATGAEHQFYYNGGAGAYEAPYYNFMATDSAGGFYMTWEDANTAAGNNKSKVCVQHVLPNGTITLGAQGATIFDASTTNNYSKPQLVSDGMGGFIVSAIRTFSSGQYLVAMAGIESAGVINTYGSAILNQFIDTYTSPSGCGSLININQQEYFGNITDYHLVSNLQQGCLVSFRFILNQSGYEFIGSNQLIRVKKNSIVTRNSYLGSPITGPQSYAYYTKNQVVPLRSPRYYTSTITACVTSSTATLVYSTYIQDNGFEFVYRNNTGTPILAFPKVAILPKTGNITPTVYTFNCKSSSTANNPIIDTFFRYQFYDSLPYQLASDTTNSFIPAPPADLKQMVTKLDTLLSNGNSSYTYNYMLKAEKDVVYLTAKARSFATGATENSIYLQKLKLYDLPNGSCAFRIESPGKQGREVAKNITTGTQSTSIDLSNPGIALDAQGNAFFYVSEYYRHIRVSPVADSCKLLWGAGGGKLLGSGYIGSSPYRALNPTAVILPANQRAVVMWQENYRSTYSSGAENIMLRNVDSVTAGIQARRRPVSLLTNNTTGSFTLNPQIILGTSNGFGSFEQNNGTGTYPYNLVAEISDNNNLGAVTCNVYQHVGTVRQAGGTFYLNRNYSITPANQPSTPVTVRLFFTQQEFDALKLADPLISNVGSLAVTKLNTNTAPATYPTVNGAQLIPIEDWKAVEGGYYIQFKVSSFSSFWIHRNTNTALPTSIVQLSYQCNNNTPTLYFTTANQQQLSTLNIEQFANNNWQTSYQLSASNTHRYQQTLQQTGLYRIKAVDKDNRIAYSHTVSIQCGTSKQILLAYPNPANNHLQVQVQQPGATLYIYNTIGVLVAKQLLQQTHTFINLQTWPAGMYTLVYNTPNGQQAKQWINKQ